MLLGVDEGAAQTWVFCTSYPRGRQSAPVLDHAEMSKLTVRMLMR